MQSLTALLERDTAFARLAPGVEQMAQLAADVSRLLPDGLAPHIFAGPVREGTLTLFAAHGALAARLRHLEPHLAQNLQRRGWAIHALRIRIRQRAPVVPPAPKTARISPAGLSCLDQLRRQLAPSPLQMALARFIDRHLPLLTHSSPES
ncbi:conserved hypothetical protein [Candidatus Glomeribacter gigasporarum BEG34]|uniref:DUF721 domain-containing protein n=1 Tax=Candidatus Glomeribacter gigasporarum BEG34 TaxID=1070319 RepID=G2J9I5_9BURK|nr:DciA family protein [Candidatus Glomeribacter gigasporarum]CCD29432.1 conserved hypothetical protein [Candidatus Glomeribacter gigasporarum BEG34]